MPTQGALVNLGFWLGFGIVLSTVALMFYQQARAMGKRIIERRLKGEEIDPIRYYFPLAFQVLLVTAGFIMVVFARGPAAPSQAVQLNAPAGPKPAFVQAHEQDEQAIEPETRAQVREDAAKRADDREQADLEAKQEDNEQVGESIRDFRDRVINREAPKGTEHEEETR